MPLLRRVRCIAVAVARWVAPTGVAACFAAIVSGAVEAGGSDTAFEALATAGFLSLLTVPTMLVLGAMVRGLWAAWSPESLGLIEEGGGSPRFAGWLGSFVILAAGVFATIRETIWLLAASTAFKPITISIAMPAITLAVLAIALVLSRPLMRGLATVARTVDRGWRAKGHSSLIRPTKLVLFVALALLAAAALVWKALLSPAIGTFDTSVVNAPALALLATLFAHIAWRAWPRGRKVVGPLVGGVTAVIVGCALITWQTQPSLTLTIWGDRPVAGLAIDSLFDLDAIRSKVSLAEFMPTPLPGAEHPDIILVTIDTVRADHTPPYGGTADMPTLKELAARGTVFEWAISPSNVTRRSLPSMIIGLAPDRVRGRVVGWALRVDPRHVLLAERMRAGGYETAGFVCCEGFWGSEMHTGLSRGIEHLEIEPNGLALARRARVWLEERAKQPGRRPLFLWMHILEPHNWATASGDPADVQARRKVYDKTLTLSDSMLTELLAPFADRSPTTLPIVIVTADHGEGLGEHGNPYHSTDLYNSQTHVPLVIAGPGIKTQRIVERVSLTDLTPSILDLAGFAPPTGLDGVSFADLANGKRAQNPEGGAAYAAMIRDRSNPGGVTAMTLGHWKLIKAPTGLELYDVKADPGEMSNLYSKHPPILDELMKSLGDHEAAGNRSPFK